MKALSWNPVSYHIPGFPLPEPGRRGQSIKVVVESLIKSTISDTFNSIAHSYPIPTFFAPNGILVITKHLIQEPSLFIDIDGKLFKREQIVFTKIEDRVLSWLDLEVYKVTAQEEGFFHSRREDWKDWSLALRMGLIQKVLEQTKTHLSNRFSGGIKTIHHQVIKTAFAECVAELELIYSILESIDELKTELSDESYSQLHEQLSELSTEPLKLMGGHGYLSTGTSKYGYLSEMIRNLN